MSYDTTVVLFFAHLCLPAFCFFNTVIASRLQPLNSVGLVGVSCPATRAVDGVFFSSFCKSFSPPFELQTPPEFQVYHIPMGNLVLHMGCELALLFCNVKTLMLDIHTHPYTTIACAAGVVKRGPLIGSAHAIATVESEGCAS